MHPATQQLLSFILGAAALHGLLLDARFRHFAIEAVGLESGFANKTTFNRVFKKVAGMTPSAYLVASGKTHAPVGLTQESGTSAGKIP